MKKLSRKALNKSFRNWFYGHLTCFSQEHMQTSCTGSFDQGRQIRSPLAGRGALSSVMHK